LLTRISILPNSATTRFTMPSTSRRTPPGP
jgi:hypothetical protein